MKNETGNKRGNQPEGTPSTEYGAAKAPDTPLDSEEIFAQVHDLFNDLLAEARYILKAGTTQNKIALMRSVIPALMKELASREESRNDAATRDLLKNLFAETRSSIKDKPVINDLPDDH